MRGRIRDRVVLPCEEQQGIAAARVDPLRDRDPPVLLDAQDPRDEHVREPALAELGRDSLHELATARVGPLVVVRGEHARRVGRDEPKGVPCDGLEPRSFERLEVLEAVEKRAEAGACHRCRVGIDHRDAIRVARGEKGMKARAGGRVQRGHEMHSDRGVGEEVRARGGSPPAS